MKVWKRTGLALAIATLPAGVLAQDFDKGQSYWDGGEFEAAFAEWQPLAEIGHPVAQRSLAYMYEHGVYVDEDDVEAVRLYRLAALQGDVPAQFRLGFLTAEGTGTPQDYFYAHIWLNIAGANGVTEAFALRDAVAKKMHPSDVLRAQKRADECFDQNYTGCDYPVETPPTS
ncbi:MAG: sel1 repeat family protein [Maritimibacter sp.]|nr:sel1 repeat family protein [Maritimibacter sp.]